MRSDQALSYDRPSLLRDPLLDASGKLVELRRDASDLGEGRVERDRDQELELTEDRAVRGYRSEHVRHLAAMRAAGTRAATGTRRRAR
jgi:hypothetical protein